MRILYLSQYFAPEVGATQARAHDMAKALVGAGHNVVMVSEFPNHPSGRIPASYHGRVFERASLDGIEVIRVWVKASPIKTFSSRMAFYLSYMLGAVLAGIFLARGKFDLVFASSPPLFVGWAGLILSRVRRCPFVFEVRDLWPATAVAIGELRSANAIAMAERIEQACYRRARRVITVSSGCRDHLLARGVPADRIAVIRNGADTELYRPIPWAGASLRRSLGLEGTFVVLYAGLHGIAQGLEVLLEAAARLQRLADVKVLFVGEGPVKARLMGQAQALGLTNVMFHPEVPRERMPAFLSMANVAVVPLRRNDVLRGALPLKLYEAWACERPTVLAAEGEAVALQERARAGLAVAAEDPQALANAILRLRANPRDLEAMGRNGRRFVLASYTRRALGRQLVTVLEDVDRETVRTRGRPPMTSVQPPREAGR